MNGSIYDDGTITVTPTEIRAKGFVLYVENVSSISVNTVRPGMWLTPFFALLTVLAFGFVLFTNRMFGSLFGQQSTAASILPFLALLPLCVIDVLVFLVRISRLFLQTTGGPVMLASKISLTDPYDTVMQYKQIKAAIEKGISLRKKQTLQPA
jgi:hypothetical protein